MPGYKNAALKSLLVVSVSMEDSGGDTQMANITLSSTRKVEGFPLQSLTARKPVSVVTTTVIESATEDKVASRRPSHHQWQVATKLEAPGDSASTTFRTSFPDACRTGLETQAPVLSPQASVQVPHGSSIQSGRAATAVPGAQQFAPALPRRKLIVRVILPPSGPVGADDSALLRTLSHQGPAFEEPTFDASADPLCKPAAADLELQELIRGFDAEQAAEQHREADDGLPDKDFRIGSRESASRTAAVASLDRPMPGFDQDKFQSNPLYREYISALLSGHFNGSFNDYITQGPQASYQGQDGQRERSSDDSHGREEPTEQDPNAGEVPGPSQRGRAERLPFLHNNVIYTGDGAVAANSANRFFLNNVNSRVKAHNRSVEGPPAGEILVYPLRRKMEAIYNPSIADLGLERSDFAEIVNRIESIRMATKAQVDKKGLALMAGVSLMTLGAALPALAITGYHKKSDKCGPPVNGYLEGVNRGLRARGIPIVWLCRFSVIMGAGLEIMVGHSPL